MKKRVVLVLMAAMLVVGVPACGSKDAGKKEEAKTEQKATGKIGTVSIDDLNTTDTQVIDIREEEQYIGWETEDGKVVILKEPLISQNHGLIWILKMMRQSEQLWKMRLNAVG